MTPLELSEVTLQVMASPTIIIMKTLEVSFMLLENLYSTVITHDDRHLQSSYFYITGYILLFCYIKNKKFYSFDLWSQRRRNWLDKVADML